jgi:hypothetical protein
VKIRNEADLPSVEVDDVEERRKEEENCRRRRIRSFSYSETNRCIVNTIRAPSMDYSY